MTYPELVGRSFGYLTVISGSSKRPYCVTVRCVCGTVKPIRARELTANRINAFRKTPRIHSCGCMASKTKSEKRRTHGGVGTPEHESWASMLSRCLNSAVGHYSSYGGRGITVCERWRTSFANFRSDMGPRPAGTSLDRIDVNGNYEPGNCRWATQKQQGSNTRRTRFYVVEGQRLSMKQVAVKVGMSYWTLRARLDRGVPIEQAVSR